MHLVPKRAPAGPPPAARIVFPESVHDEVPDWARVADEDGLAERNPDVLDNQVATPEVSGLEVRRLDDRLGVLSEPAGKGATGGGLHEAAPPRPPPGPPFPGG